MYLVDFSVLSGGIRVSSIFVVGEVACFPFWSASVKLVYGGSDTSKRRVEKIAPCSDPCGRLGSITGVRGTRYVSRS